MAADQMGSLRLTGQEAWIRSRCGLAQAAGSFAGGGNLASRSACISGCGHDPDFTLDFFAFCGQLRLTFSSCLVAGLLCSVPGFPASDFSVPSSVRYTPDSLSPWVLQILCPPWVLPLGFPLSPWVLATPSDKPHVLFLHQPRGKLADEAGRGVEHGPAVAGAAHLGDTEEELVAGAGRGDVEEAALLG